jgi:hypothetical protein
VARVRLLLAVLLAAVAARPLSATIVAGLDLAQLVERADRVVHGRVVSVSPVRVEGRYTDSIVTLVPTAVMKGATDGEIVFRVPGGEIGRFRTVVVGAPVLHVEDEVVVFLAGAPPLLPHLVGFGQGVLPVVRDDTGRALLLVPPTGAVDSGRASAGSGAARVLTLQAFAEDVRALVAARGDGRRRQTVPGGLAAAGPGLP